MKTMVYNEMSYHEFEELVEATYGRKYEFVVDEECSNHSNHSYHNFKKDSLDEWETEDFQKFLDIGSYQFLSCILLQDLVNKELIPEGNYLITVSW